MVDPNVAFSARFGVAPTVMVRSPGRVNLIGEHTDYSLFPVLPIAIQRAIEIAAGPGEAGLVAYSDEYRDGGEVETSSTGWLRYVRTASEVVPGWSPTRIQVGGDLPGSGGLSSSSALTIGVLAALAAVADTTLPDEELISAAVEAERLTGVEGGAMDQTVITLAKRQHALRIDFLPTARIHIPVPPDFEIVIAYSGSAAPKGTTAGDRYNQKVVACRAAAALLANQLSVDAGDPPLLGRLPGEASLLASSLPATATAADVADATGLALDSIVGLTARSFDAGSPLPLKASALHVFSEADRVTQAEICLRQADIDELGRLLNESHASLQRFGASTPDLDRLVLAMVDAGAVGARLTGAGFGGWAVGVMRTDKVEAVIAAALQATDGPAFRVVPSDGLSVD